MEKKYAKKEDGSNPVRLSLSDNVNAKLDLEDPKSTNDPGGNRWCKRRHFEPDALNEWKLDSLNVVDECIKFYSQNNNLLPPNLQSTLAISNSTGLSEIVRDIRTSTYQICRMWGKTNSINHI